MVPDTDNSHLIELSVFRMEHSYGDSRKFEFPNHTPITKIKICQLSNISFPYKFPFYEISIV